MTRRTTYLLSLAALATLVSGCFLRTDYLLSELNKPSEPKAAPPPIPARERVARLTRSHLVDSYVDPRAVAQWMSAMGNSPQVILDQAACLRKTSGDNNRICYETFIKKAVTTSQWGLPQPPKDVDPNNPAPEEVDAARFLANVMGIAQSLVSLQDSLQEPVGPDVLGPGILEGAESAAQYISARRWSRKLGRPSNAVVLSGGGANGAFSAGIMWRLLGILEQCRNKPEPEGCGDARIDLAAGTSTGALISTLVDLFHTQGQEAKARQMLLDNYTCSVESDLYCVNSTWIWKIASDLRGLVRFDGVQGKLRGAVTLAQLTNDTELVTVSVDFSTCDVYGISDQDPQDIDPNASEQQRVEGVVSAAVASIVEPVLAEPVPWLPSNAGRFRGTFLDGGVRSGLPLLQAVQRGAERVLIISTGGLQAETANAPPHAVSTLMRTIDLFVAQPRVGEVQQGELAAIGRRFAEYNVCGERLAEVENTDNIGPFCSRTGDGFLPKKRTRAELQAATSMWLGSARFEQVATSWRSAWMFRPESTLQTASGYSFSPAVMRPLFQEGVKTFQQRCTEVMRLFEIRGAIAEGECNKTVDEAVAEAEKQFSPVGQCTDKKPEQRECD